MNSQVIVMTLVTNLKTSIDYALKHPQVKDDMKQYIIDLGKKLDKKKN